MLVMLEAALTWFGLRPSTFDVPKRWRFTNNAHHKSFERLTFKNPANYVFKKITYCDWHR
jgi:hypothetical protein